MASFYPPLQFSQTRNFFFLLNSLLSLLRWEEKCMRACHVCLPMHNNALNSFCGKAFCLTNQKLFFPSHLATFSSMPKYSGLRLIGQFMRDFIKLKTGCTWLFFTPSWPGLARTTTASPCSNPLIPLPLFLFLPPSSCTTTQYYSATRITEGFPQLSKVSIWQAKANLWNFMQQHVTCESCFPENFFLHPTKISC